MLFILFDIEVVFLWSWLTVYANPGLGSPEANLAFQTFSFWAVLVYMVLWIIGDAYVLKLNAINWDEAESLAPAKMGLAGDEDDEEFEVLTGALNPAGVPN
jgi:NADH-quinone oxidoreductase subunit A